MPLRVFIGSSSKSLELAEAVQVALDNHPNIQARLWNSDFFQPGCTSIETLCNASFDFAVLLLTCTDLVSTGGKEFSAPCANIIFELGLFMGKLGQRRAIMLCESDVTIPSDLIGVTYRYYKQTEPIDYAYAVQAACNEIKGLILKLGHVCDAWEIDYGVKIENLDRDARCDKRWTITGKLKVVPDPRNCMLCVVHHKYGKWWPQEPMTINDSNLKWQSPMYGSDIEAQVVSLGKTARELFDMYRRIGKTKGQWVPFEELPRDVKLQGDPIPIP